VALEARMSQRTPNIIQIKINLIAFHIANNIFYQTDLHHIVALGLIFIQLDAKYSNKRQISFFLFFDAT
jgi:hypothetical protein